MKVNPLKSGIPGYANSILLNLYLSGGKAAIFFVLFFSYTTLLAQERLETPVKVNVDGGNFEQVSVVIKNNTTNESQTIAGEPKLNIVLKLNSDYVLSFSKPGYITKKIALNTTAPADRIKDGFYPFSFEVNLFKQYDGVNIVIFNQPVGKISFNRLIDDFDYDTDYTKQIQSALKAAEEEIKQKQKEEVALAAQKKKEEEQKKADELALAKQKEKEKVEADKKAAQEAKEQAAQTAKANTAAEDERKKAQAKMEADERAKAKAYEDQDARKNNTGVQGNDDPTTRKPSGSGADVPGTKKGVAGADEPVTASASGTGEDLMKSKPSMGGGDNASGTATADANKFKDKGITKAPGSIGVDEQPGQKAVANQKLTEVVTDNTQFEVLPDLFVEEIDEGNRKITRVTVRKNQKETVFSKVIYNWGGVYYFRHNVSISESLYFMNTGKR